MERKLTFAEDIEAAIIERGEAVASIVAVRILSITADNSDYMLKYETRDPNPRDIPKNLRNKKISWETARPLLDYKYDSGFGDQDCHAIHVWTEESVYFIHEYNGSTSVISVPRNP